MSIKLMPPYTQLSCSETGVYWGKHNFLSFDPNVDLWYSLELPHRGGSNVYILKISNFFPINFSILQLTRTSLKR